MAIALRSTGTVLNVTNAVITPVLPTLVAGDLLLVASARRCTSPAPAPSSMTSGWAMVPVAGGSSLPQINAGNDGEISLFYKIAAGGDGNPSFTYAGAQFTTAVAFAISGVDTGDPFDADAVTASLSATTTPDPPAVTVASSGAAVVTAIARRSTTTYNALPSGFSSWINSAGSSMVLGVAALLGQSPGSVDPGTWTLNTSDDTAVATIAIKPASGRRLYPRAILLG